MTYEKMVDRYGLCHELDEENTRKLEEILGVNWEGLPGAMKRLFSGEKADTDFRDFCELHNLERKCFVN